MFGGVSKLLTRLGKKHPRFKENPAYRFFLPCYAGIRTGMDRFDAVVRGLTHKPDPAAAAFFDANADRVNAVAAMLADETSREVWLGLVKYRQTRQRKDYPRSDWKTPQYFIPEMPFGPNEVFVDCGAYTGDTIAAFVKRVPDYKQITAFEPDDENHAKIMRKHAGNGKITAIRAGVYETDGEVGFSMHGNMCSALDTVNDNAVKIEVRAIDSLNLDGVTFVKMDIEGAESGALKGATKTIRAFKPKLAICIYHSHEDMLGIAEYIRSLVPEYKLYVRQHGRWPTYNETVLYAVPP